MNKSVGFVCVAAVLMGVAGISEGGTAAVGGKVGTLGLGADLTLRLGEQLNLRGGINGFNYDRDVDFEEDTVNGEVDLMTVPVLLDWHPGKNNFRLSAGVVMNDNEVVMTADAGQSIELDGTDFTVADLSGKITFDELGIYFGIGYGNAVAIDTRWQFVFDLGVMYHGEPEVEASAVASDPRVQGALDAALAQEVAELQDDVKDFKFYPVLSFGVSCAF